VNERWRLLSHDAVGAAEGLALDEALMAGYRRTGAPRSPTLRLYTYRSHAALVGRYQHLDAEVDLDACRRSGTAFGRRPTGGGAIVMGEGQLGVAVVGPAPTAESPKQLLARLSGGIVAGLAELGIEASFRGKNDLEVGGRKIAGLGLYVDGEGALLFHSSVLADLDVAFMLEVLRIPAAKLGDKGVAAVRERVTTVTAETGRSWTGAELRDVVALGFAKALGVKPEPGEVDLDEEARARRLVEGKYANTEWLYQRTPQPDANGSAVLKTPGGLVRVYMALSGTTIKSVLFTGDFNSLPPALAAVEAALRWKRLERSQVEALVGMAAGEDTGLEVPQQALVDALMEAGERALAHAAATPVRPEGSCYFPEVG
jgi:lipoate---protein ligase